MNTNLYLVLAIAIMAGITLLLRMLPFLIFKEGKTPAYVDYLGKYLPFAIIGMLVIYCLKDVSVIKPPYGLPQLISIALVAILHVWKRNTLLSMIGGTVCYMVLIRIMI